MTNLEKALSLRFTDESEIQDVSKHGCSGGVSGFIYSLELHEFFTQHEEDIMDVLDELCLKPTDLVKDPEYWTFQEMKEAAVWVVVEHYCHCLVDAFALV